MKTTPLPNVVRAQCVTDDELVLEQALERIQYELETQIEVEQACEHGEAWTPDYTEGFIDGLKRALELMPEAIAPEGSYDDDAIAYEQSERVRELREWIAQGEGFNDQVREVK